MTPTSAQVLQILLNTNDCINCISSIGTVEDLDLQVSVVIQCNEQEQRFIPTLLANYDLKPNERVRVEYLSENKFNNLVGERALCRFLVGDRCLMEFPLAELSAHIPAINTQSRSYANTTRIPFSRSIPLSDYSVSSWSQGHFAIADLTLKKAYEIDLTKPDSAHIEDIVLSDRWKRDFITNIGLDTLQYDSLQGGLRSWGMQDPSITALSYRNDTLFMLADIRYPEINDSMILLNANIAVIASVTGRIAATWFLDWEMAPQVKNYLASMDEGFSLNGSTLTLPLVPYKADPAESRLIAIESAMNC